MKRVRLLSSELLPPNLQGKKTHQGKKTPLHSILELIGKAKIRTNLYLKSTENFEQNLASLCVQARIISLSHIPNN